MPFLPPNQQRQSTEGNMVLLYTHEKIKVIDQVEVPLKIDWKRKPYFDCFNF